MNHIPLLPLWLQIIISFCLLVSGVFTFLGGLGLLRFKNFYLRMHPTAIVFTLGAWTVCLAAMLFFSFTEGQAAWKMLLLIPLIIITMPISTVILTRTVLFRWRNIAHPAPPALSYTFVAGDLTPEPTEESTTEEIQTSIQERND